MGIRRYDIGREYAHSVGAPAITEQPNGAYVRHDDHQALADEWRAEKGQLEQIAMAQTVTITELREGMDAVGAGGVSLMGDAKDAEIAEYRRILGGLPQDAIDGGWTAKGISAYVKSLESERDRLREALQEHVDAYAVPSTVCKERAAYEKARAALIQQEQV